MTLDVPVDVGRSQALLPSIPAAPILAANLCEVTSAPGRQVASMIRPTFLRTLASELSVVAKATSLAETNPSLTSKSEFRIVPLSFLQNLQLTRAFTSQWFTRREIRCISPKRRFKWDTVLQSSPPPENPYHNSGGNLVRKMMLIVSTAVPAKRGQNLLLEEL